MEPPVAESELIRRAQSGDARAFDALVRHYTPLVLSLTRKILRHAQDAEDVAQEAFLRLYRSLPRVDAERPLEAWIVRIAINAARSHAGRAPSRREAPLDDVEPAAEGREAERSDLLSSLRAALGVLTPRERDVFLLRDVQGLETQVVAEALEISPVTVRRQSGDARKKVEAWLREHRPEIVRGLRKSQ